MNKTSLFFVTFALTFLSVFSQKPQNNQISITGNIIDSNTKEPLEYATVVLNNLEIHVMYLLTICILFKYMSKTINKK